MKKLLAGVIAVLVAGVVDGRPLKEVYAGEFRIGAALTERYVTQPADQNAEALRLLKQ